MRRWISLISIGIIISTLTLTGFVCSREAVDARPESGKAGGQADPEEAPPPDEVPMEKGNTVFGVNDYGIFSDLDSRVSYPLPAIPDKRHIEILVNKKMRTLSVLYKGVPIKTYPVSLGFTPEGDKTILGDGKTPEGSYYVCEMLHSNLDAKYGARSMRLSYPTVKDAARGKAEGLITQRQFDAVERAVQKGRMPPQNTRLGSSIRIHGGGIDGDWTAGCIALRDNDVTELYDIVRDGTVVNITADGKKKIGDRDADGIPDQVDFAAGALKTALNGSTYDGAYHQIPFPGGDVSRDRGVCTDVIIRSLRNGGLDLQKEINADILARKGAYTKIREPNTNIDHRRVGNMLVYMKRHMRSLPTDGEWLPGDIVLFDTLPKDGPDHIGMVSPATGPAGLPLVINNWTTGSTTAQMELLSWCPITHHFRVN